MMPHASPRTPALGWARVLVGLCVAFALVFLLVPLISVFTVAFSKGWPVFAEAIRSEDTIAAIELTALTVIIAVPLNAVFGIAAAWATTKFEFRGKTLLLALIDLPIAISPVVAGFVFVLLFGSRGLFGPWLLEHDIRILYATPAIVIATVFVTFPFIARELIPLMETLGPEEELAASSLGANGWQIFRQITLPNIRWALAYGIIVCTARAIGEFGAVSVVSGHIRGKTNTLPLQVEILYNEYNQAGAFAVASLVSVVGLFSLLARKIVEWRAAQMEHTR